MIPHNGLLSDVYTQDDLKWNHSRIPTDHSLIWELYTETTFDDSENKFYIPSNLNNVYSY